MDCSEPGHFRVTYRISGTLQRPGPAPSGAHFRQLVPCASFDHLVAHQEVHDLVPLAAFDDVVTHPAFHHLVAGEPFHHLVTSRPVDHLVPLAALDDLVPLQAIHHLVASWQRPARLTPGRHVPAENRGLHAGGPSWQNAGTA
jgi:hypothetical protein